MQEDARRDKKQEEGRQEEENNALSFPFIPAHPEFPVP